MKRSEMIDILIHTMSKESFRQQFEDGIPSLEKMANVLLNIVEEEGMLPPIAKGMDQDHWISAMPELFEFFKWDAEN